MGGLAQGRDGAEQGGVHVAQVREGMGFAMTLAMGAQGIRQGGG